MLIRRRRECASCKRRFTTYEYVEKTPLMVVKNDGRREPYNREKLKMGLITACKKRPVRMDDIDSLIFSVEKAIDSLNANEIPSKFLGIILPIIFVCFIFLMPFLGKKGEAQLSRTALHGVFYGALTVWLILTIWGGF